MASSVFLLVVIACLKSQPIDHYTSYHFEWTDPSQWLTNNQNNDIISCTIKIPSLCIYAIPNQPSFQLFYDNLMFDFLNDKQWDKINIIESNVVNSLQQTKQHTKIRRRLIRRRKRKRNFMFSGPFSYGCFNALCTTVLGPPQIIGPPTPRRRRRRRRRNYKRCKGCGNDKYPGYIYTGGPGIMGPMGGMTPFPGNPIQSLMRQMGGMGMGMGMSGMGMGMGGGGKSNSIHVITHRADSENKIKPKKKKSTVKKEPVIKKVPIVTKKTAKKPKKSTKTKSSKTKSSKKKRRLVSNEPLIDENEYKIIQKCVNIKDKNICLTYYYSDRSIILDYNIAKYKLLSNSKHTENDNKYYATFIWIVNKYNNKLLCKNYKKGKICVDNSKDNVVITVNNTQIELDNWSYLYDIDLMRDDNIIHKEKSCKNVFIEQLNAKLCVERFDGNSDEVQISIETIINDDQI